MMLLHYTFKNTIKFDLYQLRGESMVTRTSCLNTNPGSPIYMLHKLEQDT